jgi:hypothetical protein
MSQKNLSKDEPWKSGIPAKTLEKVIPYLKGLNFIDPILSLDH